MFGVNFLGCHGYNYNGYNRRLTSVPTDIPYYATSVNLYGNRITNLTSGIFSHLSYSTTLILTNNLIDFIEFGAFTGLTALTSLYLKSNRITNLTSGVFSPLIRCTDLDLSYNQIYVIKSGDFDGLTSVTSLDLSHNRITNLTSGVFSDLFRCTELDLTYNQITLIESGAFHWCVGPEGTKLAQKHNFQN